MQFLISIVITIIFSIIWYYPIYKKAAGPDRVDKVTLRRSFIMGAVVAFAIAFAIQCLLGLLYTLIGLEDGSILRKVLTDVISYGAVEEIVKYFVAKRTMKRVPELNCTNFILVFGMVGLGFEIFETALCVGSAGLIGAIFRGIFALHVFFQLWMGLYTYRAYKCGQSGDASGRTKNLVTALLVPIIVHGIHDVTSITSVLAPNFGPNSDIISFAIFGACLVMDAIFAIVTLRKVLKAIKTE